MALNLFDLGSLNGTYVNAERVNGTQALKAGDEIALGSSRLVFDPQAKDAARRPHESTSHRVTLASAGVESHGGSSNV